MQHAMTMYGLEAYSHVFLRDGMSSQLHTRPVSPLDRVLGVRPSRSGRYDEEKNSYPLHMFTLNSIIHPAAKSLY